MTVKRSATVVISAGAGLLLLTGGATAGRARGLTARRAAELLPLAKYFRWQERRSASVRQPLITRLVTVPGRRRSGCHSGHRGALLAYGGEQVLRRRGDLADRGNHGRDGGAAGVRGQVADRGLKAGE